MITGILPFYCSECHNHFIGSATEWYASAVTALSKCPKCGNWHTLPWSLLPAKIANQKYKEIWEIIDNKHK